jgi:hypothetical protein
MCKQTAVEWLFQQIYGDTGHIGSYTTDGKDAFEAFEKAKAMEREQIIDAVNDSWNMAKHSNFADAQAEQYYNQKYK